MDSNAKQPPKTEEVNAKAQRSAEGAKASVVGDGAPEIPNDANQAIRQTLPQNFQPPPPVPSGDHQPAESGSRGGLRSLHDLLTPPPTPEQLQKFLEAFCVMRCSEAMLVSGVAWRHISRLMCYDKKFLEAYRAAEAQHDMTVSLKTRERFEEIGLEGWDEPVFQGGYLVGYKRKFSERALTALANKHAPGEYDPPEAAAPESERKKIFGNGLRIVIEAEGPEPQTDKAT